MNRKSIIAALLLLPLGATADVITTDTTLFTPCIGEQLILTGSKTAETYRWDYNGQRLPDESRSIVITAAGTDTMRYVFSALTTQIDATYNLMANGDFEANPPAFQSDYRYAGWDPSEFYSSHAGWANIYAITHDANYFWHDFYPVKPHGGQYFALFDAGDSGYAWQASTVDNPDLVLEKDSSYLFSYWAAYPNKGPNNSPAELQFVVICTDANGKQQTFNLGSSHTLGHASPMNAWEQQTVVWKAPMSSSNVTIAVKDLNKSSGGNDFCLDDIMFQKTSMRIETIVHQTLFLVIPKDCTPPVDPDPDPEEPCVGVEMYSKWQDVILIPNPDSLYVSYQWYHDGTLIPGATEQFYYSPNGFRGTYHCVMKTTQGATVQSCPAAFNELDRSADHNPGDASRRLVSQRRVVLSPQFSILITTYDDGSVTTTKEIHP